MLLAAMPEARAGEEIGSVSSPLVIDKSIEVINGANRSLTFDIRPDDGPWKAYSVDPGRNVEIHCNGPCNSGVFRFRIMTGTTVVSYALHFTRRYVLRWNDGRKVWDLFNYTG